ncbi:hypothetical protein Nepgr_012744 [Nepenthes gracilis]|uniref:Uncharacterized protein n=1 Tax=Nepenthes gracilis TaxID=150966 RepID=A0AAD3XND1_NEPGR|nr:hypothetical protein Nepgr_012744 [Nepenthes gracilis]
MAILNRKNSNQITPRSSGFLGCFGFSRKTSNKKTAESAAGLLGRKKHSVFCWPKFRIMKKPAATAVNAAEPSSQTSARKAKTQRSIDRQSPIKSNQTMPLPEAARELQLPSTVQRIKTIPESRVHVSQSDEATPQNPSPTKHKKKEQPGSQKTDKLVAGSAKRSVDPVKRLMDGDPIFGLTIIAITLMIMLIWGRLCAVLCTSVWFYCVPRLIRAAQCDNGDSNGKINGPDFDSELYNQKIVLEGFLQRDHKVSVAVNLL